LQHERKILSKRVPRIYLIGSRNFRFRTGKSKIYFGQFNFTFANRVLTLSLAFIILYSWPIRVEAVGAFEFVCDGIHTHVLSVF